MGKMSTMRAAQRVRVKERGGRLALTVVGVVGYMQPLHHQGCLQVSYIAMRVRLFMVQRRGKVCTVMVD